jgi:hypothetical protein
VPGYEDDENMWEFMCKLGDKKSKREAKQRYVTQMPLPINSKYAFQVKDREFKIKKFLQPAVAAAGGGPTTASVHVPAASKEQTPPNKEGVEAANNTSSPGSDGIVENAPVAVV